MIDKLLDRHRDVVILLARVLLMALFVISGWSKLTDFAGTVAYMEYLKTPMPSVAAGIAVAMEVGVGIALLAGSGSGRSRWRLRFSSQAPRSSVIRSGR